MADDVLQMEGAMASFFDLADEQLKQAYDAAPEGFTGPYCVVALTPNVESFDSCGCKVYE